MIALNEQVQSIDFVGKDLIDSLVTYAIPVRTRKSTLAVMVSSVLDPGAFQFLLEVSLDNSNFFTLDTLDSGVDTTVPVGASYPDFKYRFLKVSQVSKVQDVTTVFQAKLA